MIYEGAPPAYWEQFIPEGWLSLFDTYVELCINTGYAPAIQHVEDKSGVFKIYSVGGDVRTDGFAEFVARQSTKMCCECGVYVGPDTHSRIGKTVCLDHV